MAKERLSKLQKWILQRCAEQGRISRNDARRYFGKCFSPTGRSPQVQAGKVWFGTSGKEYKREENARRNEDMFKLGSMDRKDYSKDGIPKEELCSTRSIEASVSRSLTLLWKNGLIEWENEEQDKEHHRWYASYANLTDKGKLKVNAVQPVNDVSIKRGRAKS